MAFRFELVQCDSLRLVCILYWDQSIIGFPSIRFVSEVWLMVTPEAGQMASDWGCNCLIVGLAMFFLVPLVAEVLQYLFGG